MTMKTTTHKALERMQSEVWSMYRPALFALFQNNLKQFQEHTIEIDDPEDRDTTAPIAMHGSVAVVQVNGPLVQDADWIERLFGYVDYNDIVASLRVALESPKSTAVVMKYNSPGGASAGCKDACLSIRGLAEQFPDKPVYSYSNSICASAAYKCAIAALEFYIGPSSLVGSIGTMMSFLDWTEHLRSNGIEPYVIASGTLKAAGHPFADATEEHLEHFSDLVQKLGNEFKAYVRQQRGDVSDEAMQGQVFTAEDALEANLADDVRLFDELIAEIS